MPKTKPCRFSFQRGLFAGLACLLLTAVHFGCGDSLRYVLNLPPNGRPVVEDLSNLSRSHRLLIEKWGLQIQAFVTTTGVGIDADRWASSHFTAPAFSSLSRAYFLGNPPGRPFAAWERTPGATLLDDGYAPNLIGVQFKDYEDYGVRIMGSGREN